MGRCVEHISSAPRRAVHQVIVGARRMVDTILAASRRATLQPAKLGSQPRHIEQFHAAAIQQGQEVSIQV